MSSFMKPHDFNDYRDWLKAAFLAKKARQPRTSFQSCAKQLGTSNSYLKLVVEKRRHASLDKIPKIAKLFQLDESERAVLTFLFLMNTTESREMQRYFSRILKRLKFVIDRPGSFESHPAPDEDEFLFRRWYFMAIHSLARFPGFTPEVSWVRSKLVEYPPLTDQQIETALTELQQTGSIVKDEKGWRPQKFVFRTPIEFAEDQFKVYLTGAKLTHDILQQVHRCEAKHFHMMSIGLSEEHWKLALEATLQTRDRIIELAKQSLVPERVFFVLNSMFALTRSKSDASANIQS